MKTKQKISPLKKDSLRHAGQSLDEKINETIYDKILVPMIMIIFVWALAIIEWLRNFFHVPYTPWFYIFFAVVVSIYFGFKFRPAAKYIRDMQLGRDGEKTVAEALGELKIIGYRVYNDIVGESFNVDHIIIGPAGVFTIETKTYRKHMGANSQILYDGDKIKIDGADCLKDPVKQAKGQMYWLEGFIRDNAKILVKVRPVVIFPEWFVNKGNNTTDVLVFNEKAFCNFLKNEAQVLTQEQINLISSHIEIYNRK